MPPTGSVSGLPPPTSSPPNPLKRSADRWDQDDYPESKRLRSGISPDELQRMASVTAFKDDRRASIDYTGRSPPPSESVPSSAHPRNASPTLSTRPIRTLPSPSSMNFPPSVPPSLAPPTAPSIGSPSPSYQPAVSIHTASASSATSAHIADLQHQVTLKSLALQTLQSEYASLLQKLQRERVKSQTIEKKTTVADQEVNELTSKNEELTEQLKNLESQLEASEKKRETERAEASREKDQWGRMLELGGRIQNKHATEKQKLEDEIKALTDRVAAYEAEGPNRVRQIEIPGDPKRRTSQESTSGSETPSARSNLTTGVLGSDAASLKHEISILNSRIDILRFALEEARRHNRVLDNRAREFVHRTGEIGNIVNRTLEDEESVSKSKRKDGSQYESAESRRSSDGTPKPNWSPNTLRPPESNSVAESSTSPRFEDSRKPSQSTASSISTATMASIARAKSPSPAELGFHVNPSTSSPEELIRALGPVPTSLPSFQFSEQFVAHETYPERYVGGSQGHHLQRKRSIPWTAPSITEMEQANVNMAFGSFRPLQHHIPSPYASITRIAEQAETSPHSYHSSPGPIMDNSSPTSSGSVSGPSPSADGSRSADSAVPISTLVSGPQEHAAPPAVMPPPPRPNATPTDSTG